MSVTKAIMDRWQPDQLKLPGIGKMARSMLTESQAADRLFDLPRTDWDGKARDVGTSRAGEEADWTGKVSGKVTALEEAMSNAAGAIGPAKDAVNAALTFAADNHCHLISPTDPTWKMRYTAPDGEEEPSADEIATRESQITDYVMVRVNALDNAVTDHANEITSALSELRGLTPSNLGLSAQDGRRDANLGDDGWTDAELRQVGDNLRAAGLSEDQITRLRNGEHLTDVPEGAQEYLHQFYGNLQASEVFDLRSKFSDMGDSTGREYAKALGNGILQLSNENIGETGGFDHLPQWAQNWAVNHNSNDGRRILGMDVPMAKLLRGTSGISGEKFGAELIRKAAGGASRSEADSGLLAPDANYGDSGELYESTIQTFLEVGARNHEASAAILSGEYSDSTPLSDYNRDEMVAYIARHDWEDGGKAAGNLLDWIDNYGNSADPEKIKIADRAFQGFYDFSTETDAEGRNNFSNLMDIGDNKDAAGKVNPFLADAIRQAANPYLNILGGYRPDGDPHVGFHPSTDPAESQRRTARLFTIIASDDYMGEVDETHSDGTGAGADLYRDLLARTQENGHIAEQKSITSNTEGALGLSAASTNLLALGRSGLYGAQYDLQLDEDNIAEQNNDAKEKTQNAIDIATKAVGYVPYGNVVGDIADITSKQLYSPEKPVDVPLNIRTSSEGTPFNSAAGDTAYFIYGAMSGHDIPRSEEHPEWYDDQGQLKPLESIVGNDNTRLYNTIEAMNDHLNQHSPKFQDNTDSGRQIGQAQADRDFDPTDPDNYRDMVKNGDKK